jgi:hypothetical protein
VARTDARRMLCLQRSIQADQLEDESGDSPKLSSLQASQFEGSPEHTASPFVITLSSLQNVFLTVSTPVPVLVPVAALDLSDSGTAALALGSGGVSSSHRHIVSELQTSHLVLLDPYAEARGFGEGEGFSSTTLHRHSAGVVHSPQADWWGTGAGVGMGDWD